MNAKQKPQTTDPLADTDEYLRDWARALVEGAGEREARLAATEYHTIAANKRVPAAERESAVKRAEAIEKNL